MYRSLVPRFSHFPKFRNSNSNCNSQTNRIYFHSQKHLSSSTSPTSSTTPAVQPGSSSSIPTPLPSPSSSSPRRVPTSLREKLGWTLVGVGIASIGGFIGLQSALRETSSEVLDNLRQFNGELNLNRQIRTEIALLDQRIKFLEKKLEHPNNNTNTHTDQKVQKDTKAKEKEMEIENEKYKK